MLMDAKKIFKINLGSYGSEVHYKMKDEEIKQDVICDIPDLNRMYAILET